MVRVDRTRATGRVALPAIPIDSLMNWYMLCLALHGELFAAGRSVVARDIGIAGARTPARTGRAVRSGLLSPQSDRHLRGDDHERRHRVLSIRIWLQQLCRDRLYRADRYDSVVWYAGTNAVAFDAGRHRTGRIAAYQTSEQAMAYAAFVADPRRSVASSPPAAGNPAIAPHGLTQTNAASNDYFRATLPTLDDAYLRPRYAGYLHFQDEAGPIVHRFFKPVAMRERLSISLTHYATITAKETLHG